MMSCDQWVGSSRDTPDDKIWYTAHRAQMKLDDKRIEAEHVAAVKAERVANKAALRRALTDNPD